MADFEMNYSAGTSEVYIKTRVHHKTETYNNKAIFYKECYLTCATLMTISAALVPVTINFAEVPKIVPTLLSLLVTVLVGVEGIFHFREHWKNYDLIKSFLRQEALMFQAGAGVYRDKTEREQFLLVVERVEDAIAKERTQTIEMRTAKATNEPKPADPNGTDGTPLRRD